MGRASRYSPEVRERAVRMIGALSKGYTLSPEYDSLKKSWKGLPTRASLEDLGRKIIDSVPEGKRKAFGAPLIEGFNGAAFSLETVKEALTSHYFSASFASIPASVRCPAPAVMSVFDSDKPSRKRRRIQSSRFLIRVPPPAPRPPRPRVSQQPQTRAGVVCPSRSR